ncbi:hypothetical protein JOD31_003345 [Methylopila capsulata]|uniref:Uncharacterized protein n=1 Tax=Methylopila capsulata TaxID=61654 RepID=A0ABS2TA74_9HYPH|nr:hypothetical protein [Methylopila capsulata]MBM7853094.1 hypothetical protein [Methylopila capsulata]
MAAARLTPGTFLQDYKSTVALHSKRNPLNDELGKLFADGMALQSAAEARGKSLLGKLLEPLAALAHKLEKHESFVELFEKALAEGVTLRTSHASLLIQMCEASAKIRDRALRARLDAVRAGAIVAAKNLSPAARSKLSMAGKSRSAAIAELTAATSADGAPREASLLAGLLIDQCEKDDRPGKFAAAIAYIDDQFDGLAREGEAARLVTWLSVVVAGKSAYLRAKGRPTAEIDDALGKSRQLGDGLLDPLGLVSRTLDDTKATGKSAHDRYVWALANLDAVWKYDFVGGAALRALIFESLFAMVEAGRFGILGPASKTMGMLRLLRRMGQTEAFWHDDAYRTKTLRRYLAETPNVAEPRRAFIRGICHLGLNEQGVAAELFATCRKPEYTSIFNGAGHVTFLSNDQAAACLDGDAGDPRFSAEACGFRYLKSPSSQAAEITTVACADPKYLATYYDKYTKSLFKLDGNARAHFHLMGDPADVPAAVMAAIDSEPRVSLSCETPPLKMPFYYATARFLRAPLFLQELKGDIVLTDIDIQYASSPAHLAPIWRSQGDVGMRLYDQVRSFGFRQGFIAIKTPKIETWATLNASCLFLKASGNARRLADDLARVSHFSLSTFQDSGNSNWWIDQNIIFAWLKPALDRTPEAKIFNLLEAGIPFGMFEIDEAVATPPRGRHPAMPVL